jgi:DNA polymerase-3 subunit chi
MPQIDFYVLQDTTADAHLRYACRLVEKAYTLGMQVYVRSADEAMTDRLDELLWVFRDQSFIPHQREHDAAHPCAVIVNQTTPPKHREILINLALDASPDYADYDRLIEVISAVSEIKQAGRERFRQYTEQGHKPKHHAVS